MHRLERRHQTAEHLSQQVGQRGCRHGTLLRDRARRCAWVPTMVVGRKPQRLNNAVFLAKAAS
jgi:hypothetical protein